MKKGTWLVVWALCLSLVMLACGGNDDNSNIDGDNEDVTDGDNEDVVDGDTDNVIDGDSEYSEEEQEEEVAEPFRFIVFSDTHVRLPQNPDDDDYENSMNIENLESAVDRINNDFSEADFVAVSGDLVGCLFSENADDYDVGIDNPAETFKSIMSMLDMPFYVALGNHDYQKTYKPELHEGVSTDNIENIEAVWKKVLGIEPYYSIVHNGIRLIFLNSNRGDLRVNVCGGCEAEAFCTGSFDNAQLDWFEDELAKDEPVILFLHHPIYTDDEEAVYSILPTFYVDTEDPFYDLVDTAKDKILAAFVGHGHLWERDHRDGSIQVLETGALGDGNSNKDNFHIVDVVPEDKTLTVSHGRDGESVYWGEWK